MSEKKSKGPLLYIHQPFARTPATNMQDIYTSRQEDEELVGEEKLVEAESKKKISLLKMEIVQELIGTEASRSDNSATKSTTSIQERKHSPFNRVKPFKEMDIKERLDYLINYPIVLPPPPCVFITEEKNYQGYLTEYDGNEVTIRFHDKSTKTVPVHTLKGVILIGLKK
ncbi:CotO family spore coat protein [Neobacillus drentensis]|uniref:CotO family spore coat protein n=1 Tax=Neobacillus drentensis TaxID=220684 RepID=UPI002FFDD555